VHLVESERNSLADALDPVPELIVGLATDLQALEVGVPERLSNLLAHHAQVVLHRLCVRMDLLLDPT
jgi:hypothetical protein